MTQTIHKYLLSVNDEQTIFMPYGAKILTVQMQHGYPFLWALVEPVPTHALLPCKILVRGTGHDCPSVGRYIGTFQMNGGSLVFHVFEDQQNFPEVGVRP